MPSSINYRRNQSTPLTCEQLDNNFDATTDRANHTGTQLASSISNLRTTVQGYDYIVALQQCCTSLNTELDDLRDSIFGGGGLINGSVAALRNELLQSLDEVRTTLNQMDGRVTANAQSITDLSTSVLSFSNALANLSSSKANIASPNFSGVPTVPAPNGSVSTAIVNVGYMQASIAQAVGQLDSIPVGSLVAFVGDNAPAGWMSCEGQSISRATYAALFALIGVRYGVGDGSTTFQLPILNGRTMVHKSTDTIIGTPLTMGTWGGTFDKVLTTGNMPPHNHDISTPAHSHAVTDSGHTHSLSPAFGLGFSGMSGGVFEANVVSGGAGPTRAAVGASGAGITIAASATFSTSASVGGGVAVSVMQPYMVVNYIIKVL